ncbi:MAG: YajQ family cyclic di-GMP-binding protein [Gammaproteobacteria bacterium]|nr:YajQ family cyclic di-GMP-binding protein [Gammaproteobacteria bacterium]
MPSFDVVSKVDSHELSNAVDQANREVDTRFDFKGVGAKFELQNDVINLTAKEDFQLKQMMDILRLKVTKRDIDVACLKAGEPELSGMTAKQAVQVQQGIEQKLAKKIVKHIKDQKMKVQASIQGDQLRVTGKKRDDLQKVIALLEKGNFELPLQFDNFRD